MRKISGKFLLLHTISHLLIKQLSFAECGYNISSLKERIYCGEEAEGKEMAAILIYTASLGIRKVHWVGLCARDIMILFREFIKRLLNRQ